MMDLRIFHVIEYLQKVRDYTDQDDLAEKLGISTRTLRDLMKDARSEVEEHGATILYRNNLGYRMEIRKPEMFLTYFRKISREIQTVRFDFPITQDERVEYLIRRFLLAPEPLKTDELCEELGISRSTFAQDLKLVKERLSKYNLRVEMAFRKGLYIEGSEQHVQSCVADFYFYNDYAESHSFIEQSIGRFCQKYEDTVSECVVSVLDDQQYRMTDLGIHNLIIHILITLFRSGNGMQMAHGGTVAVDGEKYGTELLMAEKIRNLIVERTGIMIPDEDLGYLAIHMIGSRIFTEQDEHLISLDTLNLVKDLFQNLEEKFHLSFFNDFELFSLLCMHMEPMIQRIRNGIPLRNPLLQTIKTKNPNGYDLALYSCHFLSERLHVSIDENEIGYLALHFGIALERMRDHRKKKVLSVCASGAGTSRMLKYNLEKIFQGQVERIDTASVADLDRLDLTDYDLIVTTVPFEKETSVRVIQVNYYLSGNDHALLKTVFRDENDISEILSAFDEKTFLEECTCTSPEELIREMIERLKTVTQVPDSFLVKTLEREKITPTFMGNRVAVPHPVTVLLNENHIVAAHMKHPLTWFDGNRVEWVFLIGMKTKEDMSSDTLIRTLYAMISDSDILRKLKGKCGYGQFISVFRETIHQSSQEEFFD